MAMGGDEYEVGYGKPPKGSQFKPGQSGNPKGRPKAAPKLDELIAKEAAKLIKVTTEGQTVMLTQGEVVIKALFQKAMKSDLVAAKLVLTAMQALPEAPETEAVIGDHELALLRELLDELSPEPPGQAS